MHKWLCFVIFNWKTLLYVNGHPQIHGSIEKFINNCRSLLFSANFPNFEENLNENELFMKRKASKFVVVHEIHNWYHGDEMLINYNLHRTPNTHQKNFGCLLGRSQKKWLLFWILMELLKCVGGTPTTLGILGLCGVDP